MESRRFAFFLFRGSLGDGDICLSGFVGNPHAFVAQLGTMSSGGVFFQMADGHRFEASHFAPH